MNAQEFCYWLQGRAELLPDQPPTEAEWKMIREHLALVFVKVTPPLKAPAYVPDSQEQIARRALERKLVGPNPVPLDPRDWVVKC